MPPLPNQRHLFDIPPDVAYFNCASRTPFLNAVVEAGDTAVRERVQPWNRDPALELRRLEHVRRLFAGIIGAAADDVAVCPAASYGLATAARNLEVANGQSIVVLQDQFPSNVYVWLEKARDTGAEIVTVPRPGDGDWTAAVLGHLEARTAICALPPCHWADGSALDLVAIGQACRDLGAALVVDGTQWVGAAPFDVAAVQPDFLVVAAYKWLLCSNGLALMYAAPQRQSGRPFEHHEYNHPGTGMETAVVYDEAFSEGARRYDVGHTFTQVQIPMAEAALSQVAQWTPAAVAETMAGITGDLKRKLTDQGFRVPKGAGAGQAPHFFAVDKAGPAPQGLIAALAERGVHASLRGGKLRLAPYLYLTDADVGRLLTALGEVWT